MLKGKLHLRHSGHTWTLLSVPVSALQRLNRCRWPSHGFHQVSGVPQEKRKRRPSILFSSRQKLSKMRVGRKRRRDTADEIRNGWAEKRLGRYFWPVGPDQKVPRETPSSQPPTSNWAQKMDHSALVPPYTKWSQVYQNCLQSTLPCKKQLEKMQRII